MLAALRFAYDQGLADGLRNAVSSQTLHTARDLGCIAERRLWSVAETDPPWVSPMTSTGRISGGEDS
jgi:hypothetical protein